MKTIVDHPTTDLDASAGAPEASQPGKNVWEDPKLAFVEPKLIRHGELERLTGGFFGSFSP